MSGTSLGYFSNLSAVFYGFPGIVAWIPNLARRLGIRLSRFKSNLGMGRGLLEPSEGGSWWSEHIPGWPQTNPDGESYLKNPERFQFSLQSMAKWCGNTLIVKNLYLVDHLLQITRLLPDAYFVVLRRNLEENAESLRVADLGTLPVSSQLFSALPPGVQMVDGEDHGTFSKRRVVATHQYIEEVLGSSKVPESRICRLDFEEVRSNPSVALSRVMTMLGAEGRSLRVYPRNIPRSFD